MTHRDHDKGWEFEAQAEALARGPLQEMLELPIDHGFGGIARVVKRIEMGGGLVTVIDSGDVGSVRAAVEAGAHMAEQVGKLVSPHVIANPAEGVVEAFLT